MQCISLQMSCVEENEFQMSKDHSQFQSIRYFNVPPFGTALRDSFSVFVDHQDSGNIVLTPIYLLIGMSLPLWIIKGSKTLTHSITCS